MSREETAYIEKLVAINRVAKVVKGGKRFSFSALVIVGDGKGRVGYANGKAREVADAVKKASERAKRFMIRIPMREGRTLHHDSHGRFGAGNVVLRSATSGTGIIAGGAMRSVFEALGMHDVVSKCVGTTNPHNMVRATFDALNSVASPKYIASKRGKKINEITSRRSSIK
ncbi:MAG: 30S ribosomal protein S5 [Holosporaceae bacterium]|jgi:small subunit ribosomal protein S5|nr:30S ribosomal protein S5 [Holosporaceae bacterium]